MICKSCEAKNKHQEKNTNVYIYVCVYVSARMCVYDLRCVCVYDSRFAQPNLINIFFSPGENLPEQVYSYSILTPEVTLLSK